jgi:uncharacterized membrane protein YkvA (DUF1232 family)
MKMMNEPNSKARALLEAYFCYMSEEGIDLGRFVEQGGRLIGRHRVGIDNDLAEIDAKISALREEHSCLARQLEFFANILALDPSDISEKARNEVVFALLYAAAEVDLIPDAMPEIGYTDDAAIAELVLSRHGDFFARYCAAHQIDWAAILRP